MFATVTETTTKLDTSFQVPKECRAGVVVNEGLDFRVEVRDVPVPIPSPNEFLTKLNAAGLCMSASVIVQVGERVRSLKVGQRAGFKPIVDVCHACDACRGGKEIYCQKAILPSLMADGSYKEYIVSPERYTSLIPDRVSDYVAGPAVFLGGGGGVGIQGVELAVAMGLRVAVVDTGRERRELCKRYGAEHFVDFKGVEDTGAEVLFNLIRNHSNTLVVALEVRSCGKLSPLRTEEVDLISGSIGLPPAGKFCIDVNPTVLAFKNQSIKGTLVAGLQDVDETLDFAKRGLLRLESAVVGLFNSNESVQKLRNGEVAGKAIKPRRRSPPKATPIPIPAFAPEERPESGLGVVVLVLPGKPDPEDVGDVKIFVEIEAESDFVAEDEELEEELREFAAEEVPELEEEESCELEVVALLELLDDEPRFEFTLLNVEGSRWPQFVCSFVLHSAWAAASFALEVMQLSYTCSQMKVGKVSR
ncbi:hypothetical protein G7Y89_g15000 [Cudoniella acicularis]|uniref:Uncharacterized protein n=1 Tax=Cudoniella acicularis TaxID=354080 RepID=A0A8H4QV01_9HELO|nr:hypothetical protein G7Y89_g15000 [Cudoniella acicularis]